MKNYQNFLAKDFKDHFIRMNIKQKVRTKVGQMNIDICLLDYEYIKNHYRVIVVHLSRKNRIKCWSKSNLSNWIIQTIEKIKY